MGTNTFANNNEISSKGASGKSIACFPDTCYTPPLTPAGTEPPIPYPNTGQASDLDKGSTKVLICNKMVALEDTSFFKKSMGDEPAKPSTMKGGVVSHNVQGKVFYIQWSQDVKFEGKGVARHIDLMTHNHGSKPGNTPPHPFIQDMASAPNSCQQYVKEAETKCSSTDPNKSWTEEHCANMLKKTYSADIAKMREENTQSDDCLKARQCIFDKYENTSTNYNGDKVCCPGHTGHHLIPRAMINIESCYGDSKHKIAPVICVEGILNCIGMHGKLHNNMARILSMKKINQEISCTQGIALASGCLQVTAPGQCDPQCTLHQLRNFYEEYCKCCAGKSPFIGESGISRNPEKGPFSPDQRFETVVKK